MSEDLVVKSKEELSFQDIIDGMGNGDLNSLLGLGILIGEGKLGQVLNGSAAEIESFHSKKIVVVEYEGGSYVYEVVPNETTEEEVSE